MKTVVMISTRGSGAFRHDLLKSPESTRFIGLYSEYDVENVTDAQRAYLDEIHVLACGQPDPTVAESSLIDRDRARTLIDGLLEETSREDLSILCYDERNLLLAAELRGDFGLSGPRYEDILPFRDKCLMKERVRDAGVRVPAYGRYDTEAAAADPAACYARIAEEVGLPFVLKPVDGNSADGVFMVSSRADYDAATAGGFHRPYEYEEFVKGTMYSVNIVSQGGTSVFAGVTEYLVNSTQVQEGRTNVDVNLIDSDPRVPRMIAFAEQALDALGRPDGASHLELFQTAEDELVFLEVAARFKGMAGVEAMQRNYGVALVNLSVEIESGLESGPYDGEQIYCYDGVLPKRAGTVESLVEPDIESDYEMSWKLRPGQVIGQGESLSDNGGTFLVWNKDYDAIYRDFQRFAHYSPVTYRQ